MSLEVLSLVGILAALVIFIIMSFKGFNVVISSILASVVISLFSRASILGNLTDVYTVKFGGFFTNYILLFGFSALFGRMLVESGAAMSIADSITGISRRTNDPDKQKYLVVVSVPLIVTILTLSGINLFCIGFTMVGITYSLFKKSDIPWHMYLVSVFGTGTFVMTMLPGSPQAQNLAPMKYLGTNQFAGAKIGIISSILMILYALWYIRFRLNQFKKTGEGFYPTGEAIDQQLQGSVSLTSDEAVQPLWKSIISLVTPIVLLNIAGIDIIYALLGGCLVTFLLFFSDFRKKNVVRVVSEGFTSAIMPLSSLCAANGLIGVLMLSSGFKLIFELLSKIPGDPIIAYAATIASASAISGSGLPALQQTLEIYGADWLAQGMNPQVAHRIGVMCTSFGATPHGGGVNNTLTLTKLTHKNAYFHYLWIYAPVVVLVILGIILSRFGIV